MFDNHVKFKEILDTLMMKDYLTSSFSTNQEADEFFMKWGVGNNKFEMDLPFERFLCYEYLLNDLLKKDKDKYQRMHKGTPFYFLAWLAIDLRDYEKALFFIDSSVSEDIKNAKSDVFDLPSLKFLMLDANYQVANRTIVMIRGYLSEQIDRYNAISDKSITLENFLLLFVKPLLSDAKTRTIISALYVFILEYSERQKEIDMRSIAGGSLAPFINHLFLGSLIFESLLKTNYPITDDGQTIKTLGGIFHNSEFKKSFPGVDKHVSAFSIQEILDSISDFLMPTAFSVTAKIRNTTGHNLVWDDAFKNPENYQKLFQQEINAILNFVAKIYLSTDQ